MTDVWSERVEAYVESEWHREGRDLDLIVSWAEGETALDVATGGGHVARRLREAGFNVVTVDPAPGMQPDVVCRAEDLPFADSSFDTVATRIAPHHFSDVRAAVAEKARVARRVVLVEDTLYESEQVEEIERLRDPTHVRSYSEDEWRSFFEGAGLEVEEVAFEEKWREVDAWCDLSGCVGPDRVRVKELLGDRIDERGGYTDTKILVKGRKGP